MSRLHTKDRTVSVPESKTRLELLTELGGDRTGTCAWCRAAGRLIPSYWSEWQTSLCPDCCVRADRMYSAHGWPEPPAPAVTSENIIPGDTPDENPKCLVSHRVVRAITPRPAVWVDWVTGNGCTTDGTPLRVPPRAPMSALLDLDARVVHLIGDRPGDGIDGFHDWRRPPEEWADDGSYLEQPMLPVLRYRHPKGLRVDVQRAATWIGEQRPNPDELAEAWRLTTRLLNTEFGQGRPVTLLATPASTGRELWARTIPDEGWECQSGEVQELIRATSGQGRIELVHQDADTIPGLVELDGRRMYTALAERLPAGTAELRRGDHSGPFLPGRYRATWEVPATWDHVGILPALTVDGWRWDATPGHVATGWVDAWELDIARRNGWPVHVTESLVWPEQPKRGPLDVWATKCNRAASEGCDKARRHGTSSGVADLASTMIRAVVLHAIGAFVGRATTTTGTAPITDAHLVPADARNIRAEGDMLLWSTGNTTAWAELSHPEWSAAIWARARARLLDTPTGTPGVRGGALTVPRPTVLGFRTDAIYLTTDPGWTDDGKPGRFRLKHTANPRGPLPTPRTARELLQLRDVPHTTAPAPIPAEDRTAALAAIRAARPTRRKAVA